MPCEASVRNTRNKYACKSKNHLHEIYIHLLCSPLTYDAVRVAPGRVCQPELSSLTLTGGAVAADLVTRPPPRIRTSPTRPHLDLWFPGESISSGGTWSALRAPLHRCLLFWTQCLVPDEAGNQRRGSPWPREEISSAKMGPGCRCRAEFVECGGVCVPSFP